MNIQAETGDNFYQQPGKLLIDIEAYTNRETEDRCVTLRGGFIEAPALLAPPHPRLAHLGPYWVNFGSAWVRECCFLVIQLCMHTVGLPPVPYYQFANFSQAQAGNSAVPGTMDCMTRRTRT